MKYKDFCVYLQHKIEQHNIKQPEIKEKVYLASSISIFLPKDITKENIKFVIKPDFSCKSNHRYIIFPIKIYGENIKHLNILILDQKTKILERFEPFNKHFNFYQINNALESFLYELMEKKLIYFLKYQVTLNSENIVNEKSCGIYCINYVSNRLLRPEF